MDSPKSVLSIKSRRKRSFSEKSMSRKKVHQSCWSNRCCSRLLFLDGRKFTILFASFLSTSLRDGSNGHWPARNLSVIFPRSAKEKSNRWGIRGSLNFLQRVL